jgi:hypothetical protein
MKNTSDLSEESGMVRCKEYEVSKKCPDHHVCVPPPTEEIRGCLISRDPTSRFIGPLQCYRSCYFDRKGLFCFNAPPRWLYSRIEYFLDPSERSETNMKNLYHFLDRQCYWTHLHKCPTRKKPDITEKNSSMYLSEGRIFPRYSYPTGRSCAKRWFACEFAKYHLESKIIITLGRDVQRFFTEWSECHFPMKKLIIINLPHPSGANCGNEWSWNRNCRRNKDVKESIHQLIKGIDQIPGLK